MRGSLICFAVFVCLITSVAFADTPLPSGAVARLGTVDLRNRQGVTGVAFSPNGKQLVSVGWGDSIRFWDVKTGRQVKRIKPGGMSFAVAFSPDGKKLASVGESDRSVRLWDLEKNQEVFATDRHPGRIFGIAYAPDGLTFTTAGSDEAVRLWDAVSGDELVQLHTISGGSDSHPVVFSPDGRLLASGDKNGEIRVWNLDTGVMTQFSTKQKGRGIASLVFTRDGEYIVSAGEYYNRETRQMICELVIWRAINGEQVDELKSVDVPSAGSSSMVMTQDGASIVTSHREKVVIWDLATREPRRIIDRLLDSYGSRTHGLAVSPDGRMIAAKGGSHKVYLWNAETGEELFPHHNSHHGGLLTVDTSPNGLLIVTGGEGGAVHLWNATTYQHVRRLVRTGNWVRSVKFLPDGRRVVAVGEFNNPETHRFEGLALIVRISDGQVLRRLKLSDRGMQAAVSPDGKHLAVALGLGMNLAFGDEGAGPPQLGVWDLTTDDEPTAFPSGKGEVKQLSFDSEGKFLHTSHEGGEIRQWEAATGKLQATTTIEVERRFGASLAFSLTGQSAVFGGLKSSRKSSESRGQIAMADMQTGRFVWTKELRDHWPNKIEIAPDGKRFAASYRAQWKSEALNRIVVGRVSDGQELNTFVLEDGSVRSLAFSRDGTKLFSGMDRGDLLVWDVQD